MYFIFLIFSFFCQSRSFTVSATSAEGPETSVRRIFILFSETSRRQALQDMFVGNLAQVLEDLEGLCRFSGRFYAQKIFGKMKSSNSRNFNAMP